MDNDFIETENRERKDFFFIFILSSMKPFSDRHNFSSRFFGNHHILAHFFANRESSSLSPIGQWFRFILLQFHVLQWFLFDDKICLWSPVSELNTNFLVTFSSIYIIVGVCASVCVSVT